MKRVKCYAPGCTYSILIPDKHKPPASCPICGYDKSEEDRQRLLEKVKYAKKKDEGFKFKNIFDWIAQ